MFRPPPRFDSAIEAAFEADQAQRSAAARRAALVLVLLVWVAYFGWDVFHSYRNKEMRAFLPEIFALRLVGAAWIGLSMLVLIRRGVSLRTANAILACCLAVLYVLALLMVADTPFPYNYQFYFICLPLIMMFMFGLFGTRSRTLYALAAFSIAASFALLPFAETLEWNPGVEKPFDYFLFRSWNYYFLAAILYLASFAAIGCAVAVEREGTAREVFARERELEALNRALRQSERDTQAKTAALVKAKDELRALAERQNVAKSRFLAEAAHDLRQPMQALTTLLGAARHAVERGDAAKTRELLGLADDASRLARSSFNAVLEISRLESGFVAADLSTFALPALVKEAAAPCLPLAEERGVEIRYSWRSERPVAVRSDRHLLARIVSNLVSNAIKYSDPAKPRPAVVIGVVGFANRARIDVVDNGVGIAEADWPKVFQPFVQLGGGERDREKGVGLGLSIIHAIIPLLPEHRLDMRSRAGRGTRFSLEVPLAAADESIEAPPKRATAAFPDLAGTYVLYVEDDPLVRRATAALFETGDILCEAYGSLEDLEAALPTIERIPDLLITDYRLPGGRTAEDVVRAVDAAFGARVPLVVLTGEMAALGPESWLAGGRVLRKPVAPETLIGAISALALPPARAAE